MGHIAEYIRARVTSEQIPEQATHDGYIVQRAQHVLKLLEMPDLAIETGGDWR
jgi:hypothetical protein